MTQAIAVVFVGLVLAGAILKGLSWYKRYRVIQTIDPATILRQSRGVSLRVLAQNTRALPGMSTSRANRSVGDLILTADRVLITSGRGAVADLRTERGRRFTSVRCTGPGRLVIEGEIPGPGDKKGMYRVEAILPDAQEWAEALKDWVDGDGGFGSFAAP